MEIRDDCFPIGIPIDVARVRRDDEDRYREWKRITHWLYSPSIGEWAFFADLRTID